MTNMKTFIITLTEEQIEDAKRIIDPHGEIEVSKEDIESWIEDIIQAHIDNA